MFVSNVIIEKWKDLDTVIEFNSITNKWEVIFDGKCVAEFSDSYDAEDYCYQFSRPFVYN